MTTMEKRAYAETYGPTVGDRVRLADTDPVSYTHLDRACCSAIGVPVLKSTRGWLLGAHSLR